MDVVIPPSYIQLRVDHGPSQVSDQCGDEGEWVLIAHHPLVNVLVILHRPQLPVLLFDEEERQSIRGDRWVDIALRQLFIDELVQHVVLCTGHWVYLAVDGVWCSTLEINCVVPGARGWKSLCFLFTKHGGVPLVYFWEFHFQEFRLGLYGELSSDALVGALLL